MTPETSRFTPLNDDYPTCERTCVTLLIYPGDISPDDVSQRLELMPTATLAAGSKHTNSLGETRTQPINGWFLSSENIVSSKDLRRHLDWLLEIIEPKSEQLLKLQCAAGMRMTVSCTWWSAAGQGGPTLWPEQMIRLASLNLECALDVSFFGSDEDDEPRLTIS